MSKSQSATNTQQKTSKTNNISPVSQDISASESFGTQSLPSEYRNPTILDDTNLKRIIRRCNVSVFKAHHHTTPVDLSKNGRGHARDHEYACVLF